MSKLVKRIASICLTLFLVTIFTFNSMALTTFETQNMKTTVSERLAWETEGLNFRGACVWAKHENEWVTCSFGDQGYHVFLNTDPSVWPMTGVNTSKITKDNLNPIAYDFNADNATQKFGDIELTVDIVKDGNYARFDYTVHNTASETRKYSLATTGDVEVAGEDSAHLVVVNNGQGVKMINEDKNVMFVMNAAETAPVDNLWVGPWDYAYYAFMFADSPNDAVCDGVDSAFCMSWTERTIEAKQTIKYSAYLEINESVAPTLSLSSKNNTDITKLSGAVFDENIGTVKILYSIDNGPEQAIDNLMPNGREIAFEIDLRKFECGSSHTVEIWAVDDNNLSSEPVTTNVTIGHTFRETITKKATCAEPGSKEIICTACGSKKTETIPALAHSYGEPTIVKEATCLEPGSKEFVCTVCGSKKNETIPALAHSYGEPTIVKKAICTATGLKKVTCTVCGFETNEVIPKIDHNFVDGICSMCGKEEQSKPTNTHTNTTNINQKPSTTTSKNNINNADIPETGSSVSSAVTAIAILALAPVGLVLVTTKKKKK